MARRRRPGSVRGDGEILVVDQREPVINILVVQLVDDVSRRGLHGGDVVEPAARRIDDERKVEAAPSANATSRDGRKNMDNLIFRNDFTVMDPCDFAVAR
jgi:hypothetical protein